METFKDIPWYEWRYQASKLWNIYSLPKKWSWWHNGKTLKPWNNTWGYEVVVLSKNRIKKPYSVHELVMLVFVWRRPKWLQINHKNWIKTDNRVENLEYCTVSENILHKYRVLWYKCILQTNNPNKWKFWKECPNSKKVNQYDLEGNFIKAWDAINDAEREIWVNSIVVSRVCNWKGKTAWGFIWKFKN